MASLISKSAKVTWQYSRKFSSACVCMNLKREGRMLDRLLTNNLDRKIQATPNARRVVKLLDKRRRDMLNKMYMTKISEVLCFGGFEELVDKGLQITQVEVKDTSTVEVYWLANDKVDPVEMQNILTTLAGKIGSQLIYATMVGQVPQIIFHRDIATLQAEETQKLLGTLEFQAELHTDLLSNDEDAVPELSEDPEAELPPIRMDTLGLPHDKILSRIRDSKKKSYPLQVPIPPSPEEFQESLDAACHPQTRDLAKKRLQEKKELKKFICLYQKSALSSSARKRNLMQRETADFEDEEG